MADIAEIGADIGAQPLPASALRAIAFACDENYAPYLPAVILSLLDNAAVNQPYDIVIMDCCADAHSKIFADILADLRNMLAAKPQFSLKSIRIRDLLADNAFLQKNKQALRRYGYASYARIFIPDILSAYEKVLYLDIDHVILGDIAYFFALDLGDRLIAAVPDVNAAYERLLPRSRRKKLIEEGLGLAADNYYIIASPMLFNIAACRAFHFTEKTLNMLAQQYDLPFPDQDAANFVCKGRIVYLPQKWGHVNARNYDKLAGLIRRLAGKEQVSVVLGDEKAQAESPMLIHYVSAPKPWKGVETDYADLWWRYAAQTKNSVSLLFALLFPAAARRGQGYFTKTYRIFGLPLLKLKVFSQEKQYCLGDFPLIRKKYGKENYYIYICGLKLFSAPKEPKWQAD